MKMMFSKKVLFNECTYRNFTSIRLTSSLKKSEENANIQSNDKENGKITVTKRYFPSATDGSSVILEWEKASNVMKKLNLEYKHMFGPVQSSKLASYNRITKNGLNHIIQNKTNIYELAKKNLESLNQTFNNNIDSGTTSDLSLISSFPLINKSVEPFNVSIADDLNYLRKHLECLSKNSVPSVTSILQKTMPKEQLDILNLWKQRMIDKLGEEGFEKYQKELFATGHSLHTTITNYLTSGTEMDLEIKKENIGHWRSLKKIIPTITDVRILEEFVTHPFLCYRGVVDCFAKYKGKLVVIDWKTSKKMKSSIKATYDNPLQIAAYVGALNFDPKFHYLVKEGLIVVAYECGTPATAHFIDARTMNRYWKEWLLRLKKFWKLKQLEDSLSM